MGNLIGDLIPIVQPLARSYPTFFYSHLPAFAWFLVDCGNEESWRGVSNVRSVQCGVLPCRRRDNTYFTHDEAWQACPKFLDSLCRIDCLFAYGDAVSSFRFKRTIFDGFSCLGPVHMVDFRIFPSSIYCWECVFNRYILLRPIFYCGGYSRVGTNEASLR